MSFNDGEYEIKNSKKFETQGWEYQLWKGLCGRTMWK